MQTILSITGKRIYSCECSSLGECIKQAIIKGVGLSGADLSVADLSGAGLSGADLSGAGLSRADLSGADLSGAGLYRADLSNIKMSHIFFMGKEYEVKMFTVIDAYKYPSIPVLTKCGKQFVRMGCYNYSRKDWEGDFWNNPTEFPNDGSKKSMDRKKAFELSCEWLDKAVKIG